MKKSFALILALVMVLTMAACGGETAPETTEPKAPAVLGPTQPDVNSWKYTVRGVDILMHAEAAPILEALGDPVSFTEEASCAFTGLDKTYNYGGFFLQTYPIGDKDYVYSWWFKDDLASNDEGICIGSTKAEVDTAYGAENFNGTNAYTMKKGSGMLTIMLEDDVVTSIQYAITVQ